jgi:hypothetical protein
MSTAPKPKQRTSFTDKERQRLRCYHNSYPCLTPQQLASWFESEIGRRVATSSIYDMLSEKYAYLDNAEATDALRKKKGPQWAELEDALFLWRQAVQPHDVTGKELKTKANEIWQTLPACRGKKVPSFSDGWLSNWRVRHGLAQAARATDVEQPGFKVGRFEEVQCAPGTSASCAQRSVPHAQRFGLSVWNSDPPLMLPLEERLHHSRINFPHSAHQTMLDSESVRASPSKTQLCPAIASSHRHTASSRARETQVNEHRKIKRAKLTASRSLVAADLGNSVLRSNPSEAITRFDRIPWYGVQELFLKCKSRRGHDLILPGKIVLDALEPILSSLNFSSRRNLEPTHLLYELLPWRQRKAAAFNARKAAGLLVASEVFKLRQTKEDLERFMYEEWFLEFIDHNVLRSASPNPLAIEEQPSSSCSFSGDTTFRRQRNLRCRASVFSSRIKNGRVNIWTRSYTSDDNANDEHAVEQFQANIVITPPADVYPVPQTIVQLATRTSKFASILSTPIISFRTIIPEDSIIFDTAKHGTLSDLQMMLSSGEASLSDCDPSGRSLINVSQGIYTSRFKY